MTSKSISVGYIGLGRMGGPMAMNLVEAGFHTTVHDNLATAATEHIAAGAVWADTPEAVVQKASIIFTCLPGPAEVDRVVNGPKGLLTAAGPHKLFVECTTTEPDQIRRLAKNYADKGADFIEACVTGGPANSKAATLSFILGGDEVVIGRLRPVLDVLGENCFLMGAIGSATIAKLVHNLIHNAILQIAVEAMAMGVKAGLSSQALLEVIANGAVGQGALTKLMLPPICDGRDLGNQFFPLRMSAKDVGLAMRTAREIGAICPIGELVDQTFTEALERGLGDRDNRALAQLIGERSGLTNGLLAS